MLLGFLFKVFPSDDSLPAHHTYLPSRPSKHTFIMLPWDCMILVPRVFFHLSPLRLPDLGQIIARSLLELSSTFTVFPPCLAGELTPTPTLDLLRVLPMETTFDLQRYSTVWLLSNGSLPVLMFSSHPLKRCSHTADTVVR